LSNTNKSATISILQNFLEVTRPSKLQIDSHFASYRAFQKKKTKRKMMLAFQLPKLIDFLRLRSSSGQKQAKHESPKY